MVIRMMCPLGHRLLADESVKGKKVQCPTCLNFLYVPVRKPRASGKQKKAWNADDPEHLASEALADDGDEPIPADAFQVEDGGASQPTQQPAFQPQQPAPQPMQPAPQPMQPAQAPAYQPPQPTAHQGFQPPAQPTQTPANPAPQSGGPTNPAMPTQSPVMNSPQPANPAMPQQPHPPAGANPMSPAQAEPATPAMPSQRMPTQQPPTPATPYASTIRPAGPAAPGMGTPAAPTPDQSATPNAATNPPTTTAGSPFDYMPELANLQPPPEPIPELRLTEEESPSLRVQAGMSKMFTIYLLAVALLATVIVSLVPAAPHYNFLQAPLWARVVFCVGIVQLIYVIWMVALPDWSTVWVGMVLFALGASGYAMFWMIAAFSAPGQEMVMGLNEFPKHQVAGWCACMVLLMGLMSYLCGRFSSRWRREFEIAKATSRKPSAPTSMMSAPHA